MLGAVALQRAAERPWGLTLITALMVITWHTTEGEGTDTEGAGTGDHMGDVAKFFGDVVGNVGTFWRNNYSELANAANRFNGTKHNFANDASNWLDSNLVKKSDLRGSQTETFLSGLPLVGNFLRGIEGVSRLEDLYNKTGKTAAYPASSGVGGAALGYGSADVIQKIADGKNDLYEFYSGSPDKFRIMMNNMYG